MIDPAAIPPALRSLGIESRGTPESHASGWESDIFRADTDGGILAVRVHTRTDPGPADHEAGVMRTLAEHGYPVPAVHGRVQIDGHPATVMAFVEGGDLWSTDSPLSRSEVGSTCRSLLDRLHAVAVDDLVDPLAWLRDGSVAALSTLPRFKPWVTRLWDTAPAVTRGAWCHLDMHPGNVLWDGDPWVVDWTSARITDPRLDSSWSRMLAWEWDRETAAAFVDDEPDPWFDAAAGLRRLMTVAWLASDGAHNAPDLATLLPSMELPARWLARGTGIRVGDVDRLLRGA